MAGNRGLAYGIRLLEVLGGAGFETHVVVDELASQALESRHDRVRALAGELYASDNQAARISSGSFLTRGMIVAPCDSRTLASIGLGLATDLLLRAADVTLKEARPLLLGLTSTAQRPGEVPGLAVTTLAGPVETAVDALIGQLTGWRRGARDSPQR